MPRDRRAQSPHDPRVRARYPYIICGTTGALYQRNRLPGPPSLFHNLDLYNADAAATCPTGIVTVAFHCFTLSTKYRANCIKGQSRDGLCKCGGEAHSAAGFGGPLMRPRRLKIIGCYHETGAVEKDYGKKLRMLRARRAFTSAKHQCFEKTEGRRKGDQ